MAVLSQDLPIGRSVRLTSAVAVVVMAAVCVQAVVPPGLEAANVPGFCRDLPAEANPAYWGNYPAEKKPFLTKGEAQKYTKHQCEMFGKGLWHPPALSGEGIPKDPGSVLKEWPEGPWPSNPTTDGLDVNQALEEHAQLFLDVYFNQDVAIKNVARVALNDLSVTINKHIPLAEEHVPIRLTVEHDRASIDVLIQCLKHVVGIEQTVLIVTIDAENWHVFQYIKQHVDFMRVVLYWHPFELTSMHTNFSPYNAGSKGIHINVHTIWSATIVHELLGYGYSIMGEADVCPGYDFYAYHLALHKYTLDPDSKIAFVQGFSISRGITCGRIHPVITNNPQLGSTLATGAMSEVAVEQFNSVWGTGSNALMYRLLYSSMSRPGRFRFDMQLHSILRTFELHSIVPMVNRCIGIEHRKKTRAHGYQLEEIPFTFPTNHTEYIVKFSDHPTIKAGDVLPALSPAPTCDIL